MIRKFLHHAIRNFENKCHYDASYLHHIAEEIPTLALQFSRFVKLSQFRQHCPTEAYFLVKLSALQFEDCGPCLQLGIDEALQAGLSPELLETLIKNPEKLRPEHQDLHQFSLAVCEKRAEGENLRQKILKRYGEKALIEMSMAIASARVYPILKRGMGHAQSCQIMRFRFAKVA